MSELDTLFEEFDQAENLAQAPVEAAQPKAEAAESKAPKEKYAKSMLFVRGIPKDATNQELEEYFSNIGPVRSCFVVGEKKPEKPAKADKDADSKDAEAEAKDAEPKDGDNKEEPKKDDDTAKAEPVKNRGFGFVQFVLAEDAARAVAELAEVKFRGEKRLMFDFAIRKNAQDGEDPASKQQHQQTPAKRTRPESS
ncbi:RNA recognition motif-containing protein, partial [Coemansia sp. S610]